MSDPDPPGRSRRLIERLTTPRLRLVWRLTTAVAIVAFGLTQVDLSVVWDAISAVSIPLAAASFLLLLAGQAVSGTRWATIARRVGSVTPARWFVLTYLRCTFYNVFLPTGIGGDAVRIAALRGELGLRKSTLSVIIDRASGLAALCLTGALLLPLTPFLDAEPEIRMLILAIGLVATLVATVIAVRDRWVPLLLTTLAFEILWCAGIWVLARALGLDLPVAALPAITLIVAVALALPISIGGTGTREAGFVVALAPLDVAAGDAIALGISFGVLLALIGLCGAPIPIRRLEVLNGPA